MSIPVYTVYKPVFIRENLNNGALKTINAMPQKDSTSDGNSSFEMGRRIYTKTHPLVTPLSTAVDKKWIGGNRDSSQITTNRRNNTIGKGSINTNTNTLLSFTTYKDVNVVNDALRRCRSGGSIVPAKKIAKKTNAPTPSFHPVIPKYNNYVGIKYPYLFH